jgi:hypothetical protein
MYAGGRSNDIFPRRNAWTRMGETLAIECLTALPDGIA